MGLLTPSAWEGVGVVTVLVIFFIAGVIALMRGWIVFGPSHNQLIQAKDDAIAHSNGREMEDAKTIAALTNALIENRVSGEVSAKLLTAFREIAGNQSEQS